MTGAISQQLQSILDFNNAINPVMALEMLAASLITGFLISLIYITTHDGNNYDKTFPVSLIVLCIVFSVIVLVIGNNLARAFSLGGSLAITRYRIILKNQRDPAFVLISLAGGLACGAGFFIVAIIFVIFLWVVLALAMKLNYGGKESDSRVLKTILPENVSFEDIFTDIFDEYLLDRRLISVRTSGLGTLFEVNWQVKLKKNISIKEFLDALRTRNNNLKVHLLFNYEANFDQ